MPELPEVQTVVDTLKGMILNKTIAYIKVLYAPIIVGDHNEFVNKLKGQTLHDIKRRGKYLIFEFDDIAMVSHLRMEGKYYVMKQNDEITKHMHIIFEFSDGTSLRYNDTRKFGRMELIPINDGNGYHDFHGLGPEPFSEEFNLEHVKNFLKKVHKPIKTVLLEQKIVTGIGNIYADEILFKMGVNPARPANELSKQNMLDLIKYTNETLAEAIKCGGTTIRSYTSSLGVTGRFQLSLLVHTKEGEPCPGCGTIIEKTRVGQRGTYYCPKCQKD